MTDGDFEKMRRGVFLPLLLILMGIYPPLATDMYLPALTGIAEELQTNDTTMNLTIVLFFIFFALSTLFWGPVSDKYGRKRSAVTGIVIFTSASLVCLFAARVETLIAARIFQAVGSGAPVTVSLAIVQDVYEGDRKKKILSVLTALMMLAPVCAPLLGALIIGHFHWRLVFIVLTALGGFSLLGCLRLPETNRNLRNDLSVLSAIGGIFRVSVRPSFMGLLILFSLPAFYSLGFVGGSSLIYIREYHVTPSVFSFFFGTNALCAVLGAALYIRLSRKISPSVLITSTFILLAFSGIVLILFSRTGPLFFCLAVIPGTMAAALQRPLSMDILMNVGGSESGAVSALINFTYTILGSAGMQLIALPWGRRSLAYGIMALAVAVLCLFLWGSSLSRRRIETQT